MPFRINGELFAIVQSSKERAEQEPAFEVEGLETAESRLSELDEIDPAGRFRLRVQDDKLYFQRAALPAWKAATNLLTLSSEEATFGVPLDLSEVANLVNAIADVVGPEVPEVVWLGDGNGPTEEPEGYLAIQVTDEVRYIPYWR